VGKPAADQRLFNGKRKVRFSTFIADVAAKVTSDKFVTIRKLVLAHGVSTKTIYATLYKDLHLSKKWASLNFSTRR
jgi:hypothetical protein